MIGASGFPQKVFLGGRMQFQGEGNNHPLLNEQSDKNFPPALITSRLTDQDNSSGTWATFYNDNYYVHGKTSI